MKLYNPDMRTVNNAVQTTPLKRLNADEINASGLETRLAIGSKITRKKKNPPIMRTTEPTCIHCINDFKNIFFRVMSCQLEVVIGSDFSHEKSFQLSIFG